MPRLEHHRHEHFAQARARGALLEDACEDAGFVPGRGHATRLAAREDVAERISELRLLRAKDQAIDLEMTANLLLASTQNLIRSEDHRLVREARANLVEGVRLRSLFARQRAEDRRADLDLANTSKESAR